MAMIYDIGLHDGRDTGHYLREGSRVVAVDANPQMCMAAEVKYSRYVRTGQLTIVNRGIAESNGRLRFWVCDDVSEWSSFHLEIASRNGVRHHEITVECTPIMNLIDEFGPADYMKIDIEGNDRVCIQGLTSAAAPKYISIEMDHTNGDQDIRRLFDLGYRGFKIICQSNAWQQVTARNRSFFDGLASGRFIPRWLGRVRRAYYTKFLGRGFGESGPWGEKTSGRWHSVDHALFVWQFLRELDQRLGSRGAGGWYDVHATK